MTRRKKILMPIMAVLVLALAVGFYQIYRSFHPNIKICRAVHNCEECHSEQIMTIVAGNTFGLPTAKSVVEELRMLHDWNDGVVTDLSEHYVAPKHITVSGEVKDGKTTFRYEGYATTRDGETVDYRAEKTFDYVFAPEDELFQ